MITEINTKHHKDDFAHEELDQLLPHIMEEARLVLPGIQTLLGFQMIAVFNEKFAHIPQIDQTLHLAAMFCTVNAVCFLLTPAALHRQSAPSIITMGLARMSNWFVVMGFIPLLLAMVLDSYVVINVVTSNDTISLGMTAIIFLELVYCWIILPQMRRMKHERRPTPLC